MTRSACKYWITISLYKGRPIYLTALEFALLHYLIKHKEQVVSRDSILDEIWGNDVYFLPPTVDKHTAELDLSKAA